MYNDLSPPQTNHHIHSQSCPTSFHCPSSPVELQMQSPVVQGLSVSLWTCGLDILIGPLPRAPFRASPNHWPQRTLPPQWIRCRTQEPRPWVACIGFPGPTDQSWLESQLPTFASSPAPTLAGELWQPLPRKRQSCCAVTSEQG